MLLPHRWSMDRDAFRQQQLAKPALDSSEQLLQPTNSAARDSSSTMPASPAWASMKVETASPSERPELAPPMTRHSLPAPPQVPQAQGSNEHQLPAPPAPQPSRAHRRTNPVCQVSVAAPPHHQLQSLHLVYQCVSIGLADCGSVAHHIDPLAQLKLAGFRTPITTHHPR